MWGGHNAAKEASATATAAKSSEDAEALSDSSVEANHGHGGSDEGVRDKACRGANIAACAAQVDQHRLDRAED